MSVLPVKIFVYDNKTEKQIREFNRDFSKDDPAKMLWLTNLMYWALNNNKSIELVNKLDDVEVSNVGNG